MAIKHGMSNFPEYRIWTNIKTRCTNSRCGSYKYYGGRGVIICERWLKFENFYKDMGGRPSSKYSIDRINNDGNYEPTNCQWTIKKQQNNNKSNCKFITYNNKTQTLSKWAEETGLSRACIVARINRGKSIGESLGFILKKPRPKEINDIKFSKLFNDSDLLNSKLENIIGKRYGKLVAIKPYGISLPKITWWLFKCDCGNEKPMRINSVKTHLKNQGTTSCGICCRKEKLKNSSYFTRKTHGMSNTKEHRTWCGIRNRCTNQKNAAYRLYGNRGVIVCERWNNFDNFLSDMGFAPSSLHTIDRIKM